MEIKSEQIGSMAVVSLSDNGKGIPPTERNRIFEDFLQVDKSRTQEKNKGVVLGLSIAREIVLAHIGSIHVENNAPQGSVSLVKHLLD